MIISAEMVRELRDKTGAGMMKCKEALTSCNGNIEEAVDFLRKKGLASADKKSGRAVSQGLVSITLTPDRRNGVILEVNCETDFVAKNELFIDLCNSLSKYLLAHPEVTEISKLETVTLPDGHKVEEVRKNLIAKIGENIAIGRFAHLTIPQGKHGIIDSYIHGDGALAVSTIVECGTAEAAKSTDLIDFSHNVALQIAAMKPEFVGRTDVPAKIVERERDVVLGQIKNDPKNASKPENILQKIVEGRIDKFYKDSCLLEQLYIKDDSKNINAIAEETAKKIGTTVKIVAFNRWNVGEKSSQPTEEKTEEKSCCCCESCA
ncbi:MAG: elongation factor Ts [Candidatus Riflebacteria bacterium]|nr:elongation factor Ts [Candidatus Riflebacteria bacterium]